MIGCWQKTLWGFLLLTTLVQPVGLAWDGDWTDASSGRVELYDNPGSTEKQAGSDPPQKYYTAAPRDYDEVDPRELDDYYHRFNKNYTPYALVRITQDLHYNSWVIPKGYYLVKPGEVQEGSPQVNLQSLSGPQPSYASKSMVPVSNTPKMLPDADEPEDPADPALSAAIQPVSGSASGMTPASGHFSLRPPKKFYQVLVISRQGKVIAVVPIHRKQAYAPARKEKIPRRALAWLEDEDRHPVLKFYDQHWIYSTDFQ